MKCSNDVLEKGNIIAQLHHQKLRNRVMPVAVDFDHLIGEPRRVAGHGWAVPCDVVGLDSKKAKLVKVRFHPSVEQLSRSDRSISSAAVRDALKYLDALLEHGEWTRHVVKPVDPRIAHLDRITHFMILRRPVLAVTHHSLDLTWALHAGSPSGCKMQKCVEETRCSLHNHSIATGMLGNVRSIGEEDRPSGQEVEVIFEKPGLTRPILRLSLPNDASFLQTGVIRDCWQLTNDDHCLRLSIPRAGVQPEKLPPSVPSVVELVVIDHQRPISIVSAHLHFALSV
ncbi:hypothetical protein Q1695_004525 [Nippostrongylus brasiliensis]|nr:hypothetical protein Q1695_004525 [Nippostrongylus brasiliensis]